MELTTICSKATPPLTLFMMSKIQNLNGTHNSIETMVANAVVVYDVKDTKFEWNSQLTCFRSSLVASCL